MIWLHRMVMVSSSKRYHSLRPLTPVSDLSPGHWVLNDSTDVRLVSFSRHHFSSVLFYCARAGFKLRITTLGCLES